jgi:hypothetical protein
MPLDAPPSPARRVVEGRVLDPQRAPVPGVLIFAVDPTSDVIVAVASSDEMGNVRMVLQPRRHNFGVMSAHHGVQRLTPTGPDGFELTLAPLPEPGAPVAAPERETPVIRTTRAILVRGHVLDESGNGLAGVRVDAVRALDWSQRPEGMRATGLRIATAITGAGGVFVLAIPGGDTQLQASAPGLQLVRSAVRRDKGVARADRPVLVMGINAAVQDVIVTDGRVLRVRLQDSIDPEFSPPAAVRAWLLFAYGICATGQPFRAHEKQALKKYWYLEVLRREPPNPATVSTTSCVPATQYERASLGTRIGLGATDGIDGFDTQREFK